MSQEGFVVDPFAFARDAQRLERKLALARLSRVAAEAAVPDGEFEVILAGEQDRDGNAFLDVSITGSMQLRCQRCLEPMAWSSSHNRLLLVRQGRPIPEEELEDDSYDAVEVGDKQDLLALVEDEVLLALPIAPRHEHCAVPQGSGEGAKESPFAGLAKLRGGKGSV